MHILPHRHRRRAALAALLAAAGCASVSNKVGEMDCAYSPTERSPERR